MKGDGGMTKTLSITQVRSQLLGLADELNRPTATWAVAVTKRGRPVLALLPWELYESLVETLEILGDQDLMKALRRSLKEARAGKTVPLEKVKRDLGF
jgi:prevent-host-death family protein